MTTPLTPEELEAIRHGHTVGSLHQDLTTCDSYCADAQWLATLDAERATAARLRKAAEPCRYCGSVNGETPPTAYSWDPLTGAAIREAITEATGGLTNPRLSEVDWDEVAAVLPPVTNCEHPEGAMTSNDNVILCTRCGAHWSNSAALAATPAPPEDAQPRRAFLTRNGKFGAGIWLGERLVARVVASVADSRVTPDEPEPRWLRDAMVFVNAVNDAALAATPAPPALERAEPEQPCFECGGQGWRIGADPLPSGEPGEPYQVQCDGCAGAGLIPVAPPPLDVERLMVAVFNADQPGDWPTWEDYIGAFGSAGTPPWRRKAAGIAAEYARLAEADR